MDKQTLMRAENLNITFDLDAYPISNWKYLIAESMMDCNSDVLKIKQFMMTYDPLNIKIFYDIVMAFRKQIHASDRPHLIPEIRLRVSIKVPESDGVNTLLKNILATTELTGFNVVNQQHESELDRGLLLRLGITMVIELSEFEYPKGQAETMRYLRILLDRKIISCFEIKSPTMEQLKLWDEFNGVLKSVHVNMDDLVDEEYFKFIQNRKTRTETVLHVGQTPCVAKEFPSYLHNLIWKWHLDRRIDSMVVEDHVLLWNVNHPDDLKDWSQLYSEIDDPSLGDLGKDKMSLSNTMTLLNYYCRQSYYASN
tara:strand:+ start:36637 stop:37569 length:933 start_codon:yes stop_codon:yes gene_type:complete